MAGKTDRLKADIVLILVAAVWGGGFVAQRTGSQYVGFFVFGAARYFLGALVMLPFIRIYQIPRRYQLWVFITGFVLFAGSALQQAGIKTTTAGNAAFITGLYVVIVPIILAIITRKPAPGITWAAAGIAVIGTLLLSTGGTLTQFASGDLLELTGAFLWACHLILVSKLSPKINVVLFSLAQYLVAGILNLAFGLIFEYSTFTGLSQTWTAIAYAGIVSTAVGFTGQVWGQRHAPAADAALILSLEAVFAALSGFCFLSERFTIVQLVGCALIFGAVVAAQLWPLLKNEMTVDRVELPDL
ncbi:MAG: DMT family transporter, partial [Leptolinea sp.]|jgi:drug/metabolite transporter (DMT)-like permease|nr:DMT family transporter [Leptolinea sp.]